MKTNRQMAVLAALGCAVLGGGTALAVKGPGDGGIRNTPHDFSQYTWQFDPAGGAAQGQMCVPCHTPHKSNPYGFTPVSGSLPPLWNHQLKDGSAYTLSTFAGPGKANLNIKSLLCLGCHDGATALDAYGYMDGGGGNPGNAANKMGPNNINTIGTDLSDDHPVGVYYPVSFTNNTSTSWGTLSATTGRSGTRSISEIHTSSTDTNKMNSVTVYPTSTTGADGNYTVECESCHQVHNNTYGTFLRFANNDPNNPSAMCVTCHVSKY